MSTAPRLHPVRHGLLPFGRRHRRMLGRGLVFTCLLVASRLALPIPLIAIVEASTASAPRPLPAPVPDWVDHVSLLAGAFVALALVAGMAEHFQRMAFAQFAGRSISDARAAAITRIGQIHDDARGDLAARAMADSARVKQGLKGMLNHITVNGLLVLGACAALAVTDVRLGLVQLLGGVVVLAVAVLGARRVALVAAEHRQGEALLAGEVNRFVAADEGDPARVASSVGDLGDLYGLDAASGEADTNVTRWEGRTTTAVHVILALTAAGVLALGVSAAGTGRISTGALFSVAAYLLLLHPAAVRFARQVTRIGSLLVNANHLGLVLLERPLHPPRRFVPRTART